VWEAIRAQVAGHGIHTGVGVVERDGGTLYCSALLVGPDRTLLGHHRKLVPTGVERVIWGCGDARDVAVIPTHLGRIGLAICWESMLPPYRMALYQQRVQLYCAPTVDSRDTWTASVRHVAAEGRCFVLSANRYATGADYLEGWADGPEVIVIRGGSCVVDPLGAVLAGPAFDRPDVLTADPDLDALDGAYLDLDVTGHYARPDLLRLTSTPAPARAGRPTLPATPPPDGRPGPAPRSG
jgi:nitrilase